MQAGEQRHLRSSFLRDFNLLAIIFRSGIQRREHDPNPKYSCVGRELPDRDPGVSYLAAVSTPRTTHLTFSLKNSSFLTNQSGPKLARAKLPSQSGVRDIFDRGAKKFIFCRRAQ